MAYSPIILKEAGDYDGIRALARMSSTRLPDTTITSPAFLPAVEAKLAKAVPTYAGLAGDDLALIRSAATKRVAAIAIRTIPDAEHSLDYSYSQSSEKMAAALEAEAAADLAGITVVAASLEDTTGLAAVEGPTRTRKAGTDWLDVGGVIQ